VFTVRLPRADVLARERPDVILLMSGVTGFDATARGRLIRTIGEKSGRHLLVAAIEPQKAPRAVVSGSSTTGSAARASASRHARSGRAIFCPCACDEIKRYWERDSATRSSIMYLRGRRHLRSMAAASAADGFDMFSGLV
jgi:hypothetical protein